MKATVIIAILLLLNTFAVAIAATSIKPTLQLANTYKANGNIDQYWVSEKLDGIRGYWNGEQLITRQGNVIHSPDWFTQHWPTEVMDGELWIARGKFQATVSCVKRIKIDEQCWHKVRYMIFDLPEQSGTFTERIKVMKNMIHSNPSTYLYMIKQAKLKDPKQLDDMLNNIIAKDGEGLMLHKANAYYSMGRTNNIVKLKKYQDAEAVVIGHIGGKGKYQGMLGALKVKTNNGITFKIGSGFSDKERANPPKIGSIITYRYNGKTLANIPRFARYYRIRTQ